MSELVLEWLLVSGPFAIFVSLLVNVVISLTGVIPSVFITAVNISFFGFTTGLIVSFVSECIGVLVSFIIYRKGIQKLNTTPLYTNKWLFKLKQTQGKDAFFIILMLRNLPFVPSGFINLAAALSATSIHIFFLASTLGKIPAMLLEAYAVQNIIESTMQ